MLRRQFLTLAAATAARMPAAKRSRTTISIRGDMFLINGRPTYRGRTWKGMKIEGLLLNSRMVQGVFDDANPETRSKWAYPDTGKWDPERNTREFVAAIPDWRKHGLLSFTVNFQGGSPEGYSKAQPWDNAAFEPDGAIKPAYAGRMARILDRADELGMAPIVGVFYFGQDHRLRDEAAVRAAVTNTVEWVLGCGYRHVMLEVANETGTHYHQPILRPDRIHELIEMAKGIRKDGARLLTGTSYGGNKVPLANVVKSSDFLLIHGNGVTRPERIAEMVKQTRAVEGYRPMPILFNEDDHFNFDQPANNMLAAIGEYASWGYFDPGKSDYDDGYQCPPVNWGINSERKKAFFALLKQVSGAGNSAR
jgi:hypothetical protein